MSGFFHGLVSLHCLGSDPLLGATSLRLLLPCPSDCQNRLDLHCVLVHFQTGLFRKRREGKRRKREGNRKKKKGWKSKKRLSLAYKIKERENIFEMIQVVGMTGVRVGVSVYLRESMCVGKCECNCV